jgi:SAM-dependent methyltransferase
MNTPKELEKIYNRRFSLNSEYRSRVWKILTKNFFSKYISKEFHVLDLGCGSGDFINNIVAFKKYGMDLNPATRQFLHPSVCFYEQDCPDNWSLSAESLDCIFTSNFFEYLPNKACLSKTLEQAFRVLKPGGILIAMGPNCNILNGAYWDFYDHHVVLSEKSLSEALKLSGFRIQEKYSKFLPYTLISKKMCQMFFLSYI